MRSFDDLKQHIPETHRLTSNDFWNMMAKYGDIIVKPIDSSRGAGVIRITPTKQHAYTIHLENHTKTIKRKVDAYHYVRMIAKSRNQIVQQRVPLVTVNGHPFDIRVIVQRKSKFDPWEVTGKVTKVAGKGYIVTNQERSKGMVLPVETAIQKSSLKDHSPVSLMAEIDRVAILSASRMGNLELYSRQPIFGLDMGLDKNGHVWIIEANLNPMFSHFRKLKDLTMYNRIVNYSRLRFA
jgi:hypothetical protein